MRTRTNTRGVHRQNRLPCATATWDPLFFDAEAARTYGRVFTASNSAGWASRTQPRQSLIAATPAANALPLYTRNPSDFPGMEATVAVKLV
ncbi:hypothetical protein [Limisphaera sp. 4302-co]|uniref:hypothetical protein n=1 Tax=Limisphaera sp. 4302-co TaxID=3400417 RepID=UPI003C1F38CC